MNYAQLRHFDVANGPGVRALFLYLDVDLIAKVALIKKLKTLIMEINLIKKLKISLWNI